MEMRYTHVDNYCHGLIIAEKQLYEGSPHLSAFSVSFRTVLAYYLAI